MRLVRHHLPMYSIVVRYQYRCNRAVRYSVRYEHISHLRYSVVIVLTPNFWSWPLDLENIFASLSPGENRIHL